ncbi:MAG: hypothetical protein AB8F78_18810 [Saprospiraceae bacterium]
MAFTDFTDCFPKTKLPLDFGELSYREFQTKAMLLPEALMAEWIAPLEAELDEFTEILPVAKFKKNDYVALVYWKAGLLHNHYRLATFDKMGNPVENRVIAGSYIENDEISTSAATITEDHIVYIVSGQEMLGENLGQASTTSAVRLGIDDGGVIEVLGDPKDN